MSNERGTADSSCALTVKMPALKFDKPLEDTDGLEGNKIVLSIEVSSPPKTIKW